MELPIARESYQPSVEALIRAVKRRDAIVARMVAQETVSAVGVLFSKPAWPGVRMANLASDIRLVEGDDAGDAAALIFDHYRQEGGRCLVLHSAEADWPDDLTRQLQGQGYRAVTRQVLLLTGYQPPRLDTALQIVPARSMYGQLRGLFTEQARLEYGGDDRLANDFASAMIDRLDEPRVELFVGRLDGEVVGAAGVVSLGQIGVIDPAYTLPGRRGQGVAGSLMDHVVQHCQRALFEQVLVDRSSGCPAVPFYESLGFRKVADYVKYVLHEQ